MFSLTCWPFRRWKFLMKRPETIREEKKQTKLDSRLNETKDFIFFRWSHSDKDTECFIVGWFLNWTWNLLMWDVWAFLNTSSGFKSQPSAAFTDQNKNMLNRRITKTFKSKMFGTQMIKLTDLAWMNLMRRFVK